MTTALKFAVNATFHKARASTLSLPHGDVMTPVYMPVGTKGSMKGLTSQEMDSLGCKLLLSNTYHLAYQPGGDYLEKIGGLHKFMNWKNNILTDSGGFQMVSLSKLCEVSEQGVSFESPVDSSKMFLRPEDSIKTQNQIGADIIMALDDVVSSTAENDRIQAASERTVRWIDRNILAHSNKNKQNLYPIVQGGLDLKIRKQCIDELTARDTPGYAIGGLSGGEAKDQFWKVVNFCTDHLPKDKPRYLMGVGYPEDLVVCSCLGVDQFDCVYSTRTARFGTAFTKHGMLRLKNADQSDDLRPIQDDCKCPVKWTCLRYSRAFLHNSVVKEETAGHLISIHNIHYLLNLMSSLRNSIIQGRLEYFVSVFFGSYYAKEKEIPQWVVDSMEAARISLDQNIIKEQFEMYVR